VNFERSAERPEAAARGGGPLPCCRRPTVNRAVMNEPIDPVPVIGLGCMDLSQLVRLRTHHTVAAASATASRQSNDASMIWNVQKRLAGWKVSQRT
jgi:hypothetical protein